MAMLYEPFAPLFELTRDMQRMFAPNGGTSLRPFFPAADVMATDDDVTVTLDVPGFKVDDLEIELVDDVLTVRGERRYPWTEQQQGERSWQRLERGYGKFERVLQVPQGLDADHISASMADGVLTLHIAKPEARKPRRIRINAGAAQPSLTDGADFEGTESHEEERELVGAGA